MTERHTISRIGIGARIKNLAAHAIRTEFSGKTTEELLRVIKKERVMALRRTLAEEELTRRGIAVDNNRFSEPEQGVDGTPSYSPVDAPQYPSSKALSAPTPANAWHAGISSYVKRHWRGEFELLESFWGNVVVINMLIGVLGTLFSTADFLTQFAQRFPRAFWALSVIVALALYSLWLWQMVGLWRSAARHIRITDRRLWARVSQIVVILSTVSMVNQSVCNTSSFIAAAKLAFGLTTFDEFQVTVGDDGSTIEVSGNIGAGLADKVAGELAVNPGVGVIQLNSLGGRLSEARRLRELIAQRGLTTYTSSQCHSACALAFIGGRERVLHRDAQLGFHQPSMANSDSTCSSREEAHLDKQLQETIRLETRALIDAGVDPAFARRAMSIPPNEIWRPTHEQLLRAGLISRVADEA